MKKEDLVKIIPNPLPNNSRQKLVISSYTIEEENKEKLKKVAKRHGYESSVSAFLNDLLRKTDYFLRFRNYWSETTNK